jgi:hypothetical protein
MGQYEALDDRFYKSFAFGWRKRAAKVKTKLKFCLWTEKKSCEGKN